MIRGRGERVGGGRRLLIGMVICLLVGVGLLAPRLFAAQDGRSWASLKEDGLHDPEGPELAVLQNPGDALKLLPPGAGGNQVDWVAALRNGVIQPRTNILPETKIQVLDLDIVFGNTGDYGYVRFPHRAHTEWLDCSNCHEKLFKSKFGATPIKMQAILEGEFCGVCHGAVAFPLTECQRCHSVNPDSFKGKLGPQN